MQVIPGQSRGSTMTVLPDHVSVVITAQQRQVNLLIMYKALRHVMTVIVRFLGYEHVLTIQP